MKRTFFLVAPLVRLLPYNVAPITTLFCTAGSSKSPLQCIVFSMAGLALTDLILGVHATIPFVYAAYCLSAACASKIAFVASAHHSKQVQALLRFGLAPCIGSTLFFAISNTGVWLVGNLYPHTIMGLVHALANGLPFWKHMLTIELGFSALLGTAYIALSKTSHTFTCHKDQA